MAAGILRRSCAVASRTGGRRQVIRLRRGGCWHGTSTAACSASSSSAGGRGPGPARRRAPAVWLSVIGQRDGSLATARAGAAALTPMGGGRGDPTCADHRRAQRPRGRAAPLPDGAAPWRVARRQLSGRCREAAGLGCAVPPGQDGAVIGRLHHVIVDCPDPAALAGFYAELLGLPITWQEDDVAVVAGMTNPRASASSWRPISSRRSGPTQAGRSRSISTSWLTTSMPPSRACWRWVPASDGRGRRLTGICGPGRASFLPHTPSGLGGAHRRCAGQGVT